MAYENLRLACSPLTGNIYVGHINKTGDRWVGDKKDMTDAAKMAVAEHLLSHRDGYEVFTLDSGKTWLKNHCGTVLPTGTRFREASEP